MAVEAVYRVHHSSPDPPVIVGYSLRNIGIETALKIPEDDNGIEIILGLDSISTETTKSFPWIKFSVSSVIRDSNEWTRHCSGLVKVETTKPIAVRKMNVEMDARSPNLNSWYNRFEEIGIGYGPAFQSLSNLRVDPNRHVAKASVSLNPTIGLVKGGESSYAIHPAALDAAFQLGLIACYGGQTEKATAAFVPVHLSQVYIRAGTGKDHAIALARGKIQGLRSAYAQLQMLDNAGEVVLDIDRLHLTRFKELISPIESKKSFNSPFTRVVWKPDIRTLDNRQIRKLFPAPQENISGIAHLERADMIACLIVADIYEIFIHGDNGLQPKGELSHWISWVRRCVEEDQRANMARARELSTGERQKMLRMLYAEAGDMAEAVAARSLYENMGEILNGRKTGIDVLVNAGVLTSLYETGQLIAGSHPQLFNILDCLGHVNPNMRILEIGAGTGAATRVAMRALGGLNGIKRYADYTFTDVSAGFFAPAREFMSQYRDINYSILDIDKDPLMSGYEPIYDVVIACEAIHATANMDRTLVHCRSLLKPGGKLILAETTRMRVLLGLLYGTLTGYWLGASDSRSEGPFMDQHSWEVRLRKTGFSGNEIILDDYPQPHDSTSVIVSTRLEELATEVEIGQLVQDDKVIYILHEATDVRPLIMQVSDGFRRRGSTVKTFVVDEAVRTVPKGAHVVVFLSCKNDLFDGDEARLKAYQHLAQHTDSMLWLTFSGIIKGRDPRGAFMIGLLRAIATENPAGRFLSIDIDTEKREVADCYLMQSIVEHGCALQNHRSAEQIQDCEFVWQDGCMWTSRVVPDPELGAYTEPVKTPAYIGAELKLIDSQGPICVDFETPGVIASLYFRPYTEMLQPLPADYIDVKVAAVGVNWVDLALASGRFDTASNSLSSEYSGVITRTGSGVVGFSVGDRVYGVGRGHFGNYTRVPAAFAQRLQPEDDLAEAATMPLVYMTALYALTHVAHIRQGQKVLIQSATGGLGLAAIQLARYKGAEIFASVGSADKTSFLVDVAGVQPDHIIPSRDTAAMSRAVQNTEIGGFDVILSTVAGGDLLSESLDALGPNGHLIDLARMDVLESREMNLGFFQKNANFSSFDLNSVLDNDPEVGHQLMKQVEELYRKGHILPIRPFFIFKASELNHCLQNFSKGAHIGKFVISFQDVDSPIKIIKKLPTATFDFKARYIITGGLGGLGRSIIRWMSDRGAQDFVVISRRGVNTPAAQLLVHDLAVKGVAIEIVTCDISKRQDVMHAIRKVTTVDRQIKGVIHAALSLSDLSFDKLTIDQWRSGIAAKTAGTLNLHEATLSLPLEFFVMITSTESVWAPPTQSSYIAATNFQEYFARHRRQLGLPASTVAYGLVTDVQSDFKASSTGTNDMYARNKVLTTTEWQVLAMLEPAFLRALPARWLGADNDPLSEANFFTCLNPAALAALFSTSIPRWHSDARVSLILHAMNEAQKHAQNDAGTGIVDQPAFATSATRLRHGFEEGLRAGPDERESTIELVLDGIRGTIADMLFIDMSSVNPEKSIAEQGVDSLVAAELRHWFYQALGTNLQTLDLLDAQVNIRTLADNIVEKALKG